MVTDIHGHRGHPEPGKTTPSVEWPPPVASLAGHSPESPSQPDDLIWPPPTADVDAVAVMSLDGRAVSGRDRDATSAHHRVFRPFRRPLVAAAGLLATAALTWSGLRFVPASTATSTTATAGLVPVSPTLAPLRPAASPAVAQVANLTTHAEPRSPATLTAASAETERGTRPEIRPAGLATNPPPPERRATADASRAAVVPPESRPPAALAQTVQASRSATAGPRPPAALAQESAGAELTAGPAVSAAVAYESRRPAAVALPPPPQPAPPSLVARAEPTGLTASLPISAPAAPRTPADGPRIQAVLQQYASAYRRLDAAAARAVWPSLDSRALARAFDGLQSQQLVFDGCDVTVTGARAQAACHGSATYVPRVGDRTPRTQARQWNFQLERGAGDQWRILTASTR